MPPTLVIEPAVKTTQTLVEELEALGVYVAGFSPDPPRPRRLRIIKDAAPAA